VAQPSAAYNLYRLSLLSPFPRVRDNLDKRFNGWARQSPPFPAVEDVLVNLEPRAGLLEGVWDITPQWIYRGIAKGRIEILKDS
jgi:hypothetical protein